MSFSNKFKTLRSGNSYDLRTQPKISTHGDENTGEAETEIIEGSKKNSVRFSPELMEEGIKASLEPLFAQISALTEMMGRLIQSNLIMESTTASSRGPGLQYESPYSEGPGSSKFPTVAPLTTAGYSPDSGLIPGFVSTKDTRWCINMSKLNWKVTLFPFFFFDFFSVQPFFIFAPLSVNW